MAGFEFTFPFEPPWEDCVASGQTASGAKFFIFNTMFKDQTEEEKQRIHEDVDRVVTRIFVNKHIRELEAAKAENRRKELSHEQQTELPHDDGGESSGIGGAAG